MDEKKPKIAKTILIILSLTILAILLVVLTVKWLIPLFAMIKDPSVENSFRDWVISLGNWGYIILFLLFALQVVIPFIPAKPFEITAGILYGPWIGLILCLLGSVLGSVIVVLIVKKIKDPLWKKIKNKSIVKKFEFIRNMDDMKQMLVVLILPGSPKDIITYIAAMGNIDMKKFILASMISRIPVVLMGTAMGGVMLQNWKAAMYILLLMAALGLLGYIYREKITALIHKIKDKIKSK